MGLKDLIGFGERAFSRFSMKNGLQEKIAGGRAFATVVQRRPYDFDDKTGLYVFAEGEKCLVGDPETVWNLITNVGRDKLHLAGYGTSGLPSNGFNYIAISNDTLVETASSTILSGEIASNGLARTQGAVAHTAGTNTTTIDKTFTATGTQSCQKTALFNAVSGGDMNHVLAFTQRNLISGDTLQITFTIQLG